MTNLPPIGGSGDLAGGTPHGSVVGGDVTRDGGPEAGEPQGSVFVKKQNSELLHI